MAVYTIYKPVLVILTNIIIRTNLWMITMMMWQGLCILMRMGILNDAPWR